MFDVDLFIRTTNTQINLIQYGLKFNLYATNCCHLLRPIQTTYILLHYPFLHLYLNYSRNYWT